VVQFLVQISRSPAQCSVAAKCSELAQCSAQGRCLGLAAQHAEVAHQAARFAHERQHGNWPGRCLSLEACCVRAPLWGRERQAGGPKGKLANSKPESSQPASSEQQATWPLMNANKGLAKQTHLGANV